MSRARSILLLALVIAAGCTGDQTDPTQVPEPTQTTTSTVASEEPQPANQPAEAPREQAEAPATLTVSGHGEAYGVPDTMVARFVISVLRPTVTEAADIADQVADNVRAALLNAGVDRKDIQSSNYSINQEYDYSGRTRVFEGFRVRHTYTVRLDLASAGRTIDAAADASWDALEISDTNLAMESDDRLVQEARAAAWDDALANATDLATAAGLTLGDPLSITESSSVTPPDPYWYGGDGANGEEPFEPGRLVVRIDLRAEFAATPSAG